MSYIKFQQKILINEKVEEHTTIDMIKYLETHIGRRKTYVCQGEEKTLVYNDKLVDILLFQKKSKVKKQAS